MLSLVNLVCGYGKVPVIGPMSFELARGQALVLYGPNGIGKTTFLRTVATLIPPISGQILFDGRPLMRQRDKIYYVPETVEVPTELTSADYLKVIMSLFTAPDDDAVSSALELVNVKNVKLAKLSFGQRRRVQLASALVVKSPLILLDDPLQGLDDYAAEHLFPQIVEGLMNNGSIVVITLRERPPARLRALGINELDATPFSRVR